MGTKGGLLAIVTAGTLAIAGIAALVFSLVGDRPEIDPIQPPANGAINPTKRLIVVGTTLAPMKNLRVRVDTRDVTAKVTGAHEGIAIRMPGLTNGPHTMAVQYSIGGGVLGRSTSRSWAFTVDRTPPALDVMSPAGDAFNAHDVPLGGTATKNSIIRVTLPGGSLVGAQASGTDGTWATSVTLPEGTSAVTVMATDQAGNTTSTSRRLYIDTKPPTLALSGTNELAKLTTTPQPIIHGSVGGQHPTSLNYGASINGVGVVTIKGTDATESIASGAASGATNGTGLTLIGNRFALAVGRLPEGTNTITVWVRDRGGNVAEKTFTSFVDTQSQFGNSQLTQGATGGDVTQLQERLMTIGLWKGETGDTYNEKTATAVMRYQKRFHLKRTGNIDAVTLKTMLGRIDISLNQRRLILYRDGHAFKTFRVAVGMPGHETPTGDFTVVDMRLNPTWLPPNSPWAKGLGPIPPGPGNPLGTRWIGTSAPAVGIHGTPADWSIGTAASHGCIRMHIPDVENLYKDVVVGMPVDIHA